MWADQAGRLVNRPAPARAPRYPNEFPGGKQNKEIAETFSDGRIDWLDGITVEYDDWWFNVRKSNTEPVLRLNLEARAEALRDEKKALLVKLLGS